MSESALAERLHVPEHFIAYIELGLRSPSDNLLRRMEKILRFDFESLDLFAPEPGTKERKKR